MVVYYPEGKLWKERFYHGVVAEVGDSALREWAGKEFVKVRLCIDYGDGTEEVRCSSFQQLQPTYLQLAVDSQECVLCVCLVCALCVAL